MGDVKVLRLWISWTDGPVNLAYEVDGYKHTAIEDRRKALAVTNDDRALSDQEMQVIMKAMDRFKSMGPIVGQMLDFERDGPDAKLKAWI